MHPSRCTPSFLTGDPCGPLYSPYPLTAFISSLPCPSPPSHVPPPTPPARINRSLRRTALHKRGTTAYRGVRSPGASEAGGLPDPGVRRGRVTRPPRRGSADGPRASRAAPPSRRKPHIPRGLSRAGARSSETMLVGRRVQGPACPAQR